jgi:hypothetical protein
MFLECYNIDGTRDINNNRKDKTYQDPKTWPTYKDDFEEFKRYILENYNNKISRVLIRVYDGEFFFLQGRKKWNVGKRHVSITLTPEFVSIFKHGVLSCDKFASHLTVLPGGCMNNMYSSVFQDKKIDYPMEFYLAIVINKWVFKTFKNKIGLIGGCEKIKVIKELMKHQEYRDYLGIDYFTDYISVPERFSCDNPEELDKHIGKELEKSKARVFLFGIGIGKMAIAHKFKNYHNAIYIDTGSGLSALAGTTTKKRPYSADWINFRLRGYDYSKMDPMDHGENENIKLL